jgi:uncharacterized protein (TIGR02246 family)
LDGHEVLKMTTRIVLTLGASFLAIVSCEEGQRPDPADDLAAIASVLQEHVDAVNAGDVDSLLAGMTDDVVYLPPDQPLLRGKEQLRALMTPAYEQLDAQISMRAEETVVAGDWAWEWGHLSGSMRPKAGGQATELDGKYFYVYQRPGAGSWRIARDIYNWNKPSASSAVEE